jgi:hypothetical protein
MYGFASGVQRRHDEIVSYKITLGRRRRAYTDRMIGKAYMEIIPVGGGIDRHGLYAHFPAGSDDPDGDLSSVGD